MPVSTSKQGRESPRTVSHETVIRRGGAQAPTVKFTFDDAGSVVATSIRIASRGGDFGPTSHATRSVVVPLRPQAPRTVAFASGADHPAPDAGTPNFDVDLTSIRLVSSAPREIVAPTAIRLDIVSAPAVATHERPVWAHECSVCRDEWFARATLETPVLSGICTGHDASTCPQCIEAHAVKVARATEGLSKAEIALSTAKTPKAYGRAEKRVNLWKSKVYALGNGPTGVCPRHDSKPVNDPAAIPANFPRQAETLDASAVAWLRAVEELAREHNVKREHGVDASTADALRRMGITVPVVPLGTVHTVRASKPAPRVQHGRNASRYAPGDTYRTSTDDTPTERIESERIASATADVQRSVARATVIEPAPRETTAHGAYALRGVGVVATDETFEGRVVAERWRGRARALDRVCAVCKRMECPSVRRTGAQCVASALAPAAPPTEPSKRPRGVYVAPDAVSAHGARGSTYRAEESVASCTPAHGPGGYEATPARRDSHGDFSVGPSKPRTPRVKVEPIGAQASGIIGARTTPERPHGPYETAPRGRIVR